MPQHLNQNDLEKILQAEAMDQLSVQQIFELFRAEKDLANYLPDFEHLGLWGCQDNPKNVASNLNEALDGT
jgi:hypothetical protein